MAESEVQLQNLELAWKRVKLDIPHRAFVRNPFEATIIEYDLESYLVRILELIEKKNYYPKPMFVCDSPKGKGLVRPGSHLAIEDRVFYYWCLGVCLPNIYETLKWSQGVVDFSYQISGDFENAEWLMDRFAGWRDFRVKSLEKITDGVSYVIIADLAAYYENIDIMILLSDLRATGASSEIVDFLSRCLNRWAQVTGRGIPQGYSPSDFLGKLYLNSVDLNMKAMGFEHLRYVDDIRIFCRTEAEAKQALVVLTGLLRTRGLNLQSAKTKIHTADEAKGIIEGVQPILQPILKLYSDYILQKCVAAREDYASLTEIDELLSTLLPQDDAPLAVIVQAFLKYFSHADDTTFDKTLFRFLINRLGNAKRTVALEYCLGMLAVHPEETPIILSYIKSIDSIASTEGSLLNFITSEDAVYPYQVYQILEWFSENIQEPSDELIAFCRRMAFNKSQPKYLKPITRKIIGDFGTSADLERLEQLYSEIDNEKEKSEIICCLKRMERTRRNSFFSRAKNDGELIARAVELVKRSGV